ncbi:hypothetical protein EZS27_010031 [termite gut metagenome]|uniref:Uncharacterized protein n=1 Tax=termite gut metagenome TaxID=433724 RepID=A0A5J4S7W3_9ZZZZ
MKREEIKFIEAYKRKYGIYPNRLWIILLRIITRFGYVLLLEIIMGAIVVAIACMVVIASTLVIEWLLHSAQYI